MINPKAKLIRGDELEAVESAHSFAALLRQEGDDIRRDVFMVLNPEHSTSGRLQAGVTVLYPGCSTRGHSHDDREEVYFFTRGQGVMAIDGEEWDVKAGDTFYIPPGPSHTTRNPHNMPLECFWITIKIQ